VPGAGTPHCAQAFLLKGLCQAYSVHSPTETLPTVHKIPCAQKLQHCAFCTLTLLGEQKFPRSTALPRGRCIWCFWCFWQRSRVTSKNQQNHLHSDKKIGLLRTCRALLPATAPSEKVQGVHHSWEMPPCASHHTAVTCHQSTHLTKDSTQIITIPTSSQGLGRGESYKQGRGSVTLTN
jgi:hypothetical protein